MCTTIYKSFVLRCLFLFVDGFYQKLTLLNKMNIVDIRKAACLLIIRKNPNVPIKDEILDYSKFNLSQKTLAYFKDFFDKEACAGQTYSTTSEMQILWGQGTVVNWLKTKSPSEIKMMNYPGEFKLPGGSKDANETLLQTAIRETEEELHIKIPSNAIIRPLRRVLTKVIRNRQFIIYGYITLEDENSWITDIDINHINFKLNEKRAKFTKLQQEFDFWDRWVNLPLDVKEILSPEVIRADWLTVRDSLYNCLSSKADNFIPVNTYQKLAFQKLDLRLRDPMMATLFLLTEILKHNTFERLRHFSKSVNF